MDNPLKIDPEFKALIPPLPEDELNQLEENILSQGHCRDAIVTWKGIILDGHNRYAICQKHSIPYKTTPIYLANRKDARLWILENQIGRRNISKAMKIELALQKALLIKETKPIDIRKSAAKDSKSSEQTVQRYMTVRKLAEPEQLARVQAGEEKIGTAYNTLELTIKTIEPMYRPTPADIKAAQPRVIMLMHDNINKIDAFYDFLEKVPMDCDEAQTYLAYQRLRRQKRALDLLIDP